MATKGNVTIAPTPTPMRINIDPDTGDIQPFAREPESLDLFPMFSVDYVGCKDAIRCLAVDTRGKKIIAASWDDTASVWDIRSRLRIGLMRHADWVNCVGVWYPQKDGRGAATAITGCEDGHISFWNLDTCYVDYQLKPGHGAITHLVIYEDWCIASSLLNVYIISGLTRSLLRKFTTRHDANCAAIAKDGLTLFIGQQDGRIACWDIGGVFLVRELVDGSNQPIRALALDPTHTTGSYLFSSTDSGSIFVWSTSTGEKVYEFATHGNKPVLGLSIISWKRKKKSRPLNHEGSSAHLASPSKTVSPRFHEAQQVCIVSCALDGTVQYHDLDSNRSVVGHGASGQCVVSYQDPDTGEWSVFVGEHQGRLRAFHSTNALHNLTE